MKPFFRFIFSLAIFVSLFPLSSFNELLAGRFIVNQLDQYHFQSENFSFIDEIDSVKINIEKNNSQNHLQIPKNGVGLLVKPSIDRLVVASHYFTQEEKTAFDDSKILWEKGLFHQTPIFLGKDSYLDLPKVWSDFLKNPNLSSFVIDFSFLPSSVRKEVLFKGQEASLIDNQLVSVEFEIGLDQGKVVWRGVNFFHFGSLNLTKVLTSSKSVRLNEWNDLSFAYDRKSGFIELYLNEERVASTYSTVDGTPYNTLYYPGFLNQTQTEIRLGGNFVGKINEVVLKHNNKPTFKRDVRSIYASKVFQFTENGIEENQAQAYSTLENIWLKAENLDPAKLEVFLCSELTYFFEKNQNTDCPKVPWLMLGEKNQNLVIQTSRMIKNKSKVGRFYQFFLVYHNERGKLRNVKIDKINFDFNLIKKPISPKLLKVEPQSRNGESGIFISWERSFNYQIAGYNFYTWTEGSVAKNPIKISLADDKEKIEIIDNKTIGVFLTDFSPNVNYFLGMKFYIEIDQKLIYQEGMKSSAINAEIESDMSVVKEFIILSDYFE